jgi:CRISPR/Cas system-associated exonuclease Cas4 (RecB family)
MKRIVITQIPHTLSLNSYELVLTPTKAIARSLKASHSTLESVAETIIKKKGLKIASTLLARRTLQNAIAEILKVKDLAGITALWKPVIQELLSSGNNLLALKQHSIKRVSNLAKVAIFYREQLRRINCIDRSELFQEAAKHCQHPRSCLFYGYFTPNRDLLAFINALSGDNSLFVLPDEETVISSSNRDSINWLKTQGWKTVRQPKVVETRHITSLQKSKKTRLNCYPNLEAEVRGVLTQIKLLLNRGITANEIVITTKNEQLYGDTLLDIAWEYDIPVRAFYDVSLLATRIGAWLQLLLDVIVEVNSSDKVSFERIIKLLSHPLVKKIDAETWQQARVIHPQTISDWQSIGIDLSLLLLPLNAEGDRWIVIIKNILEHFTIPQTVKPWAKEIVAYYKFQEALQELLLTNENPFSKDAIITEIQELLNSLTVPIQPGRGGVELHSPLSLFGSNFSHVFVLGMAENIFPASVSDNVVLSYSDRRLLANENININTIVEIMQKEALAFYFLQQIPTKQIIFSYPKLIDKQPYYPSPYLASLSLQPTPLENNYVASIEEARKLYLPQEKTLPDKLLSSIPQRWQIECDRDNNIVNEYNGKVGISLDYNKFTFSASQLTQIGQCPFKWFTARILNIKEIIETKLLLENNTKGSLFHRCLELCLTEINTAADLEKFNVQQLNRAFTEAANSLEIPDIPAWEKQKQELLNLLSINLSTSNFLPPDNTIIEREKDFAIQWYNLKVKGKIDRLDRTSKGIEVIDYKSSSSPPVGIKDETGKANIDLQIPLYIDAMAQEYPEENIDAVYYSLSKCKPIRRNKTNPEDLERFVEQVKQHLTEGNYPIAPDIQFKACNYCQFDLVCRKKR